MAREPDHEACALIAPGTVGGHPASVQVDQVTHDRETQTEAALRARSAAFSLPEAIEHVREKRGIDPDSRIGDGDLHAFVLLIHGDVDSSAARGELYGGAAEIPNSLLNPIRVAHPVEPQRRYRQRDLDFASACGWTNGLDGRTHEGR